MIYVYTALLLTFLWECLIANPNHMTNSTIICIAVIGELLVWAGLKLLNYEYGEEKVACQLSENINVGIEEYMNVEINGNMSENELIRVAVKEYEALLGIELNLKFLPNNFDELRERVINYIKNNCDVNLVGCMFIVCVSDDTMQRNMDTEQTKYQFMLNCVLTEVNQFTTSVEKMVINGEI